MRLFDFIQYSTKTAIIDSDSGCSLSYRDLQQKIDFLESIINKKQDKTLGLIFCANNLPTIIGYLAGLQSKNTVYLISAQQKEINEYKKIIDNYKPDWVLVPTLLNFSYSGYLFETLFFDYSIFFLSTNNQIKLAPIFTELALLIPTSGTTGNPKVVRLSYQNIIENTKSIAKYLNLTPLERPVTTLPINYAYGLSIINTHLFIGATILLTSCSVTSTEFWKFVCNNSVSSISGVPYMYQLLRQLRFENMDIPSLKTLTQAGGKLPLHLFEYLSLVSIKKNYSIFTMYGQTEATARMSYVPTEKFIYKKGSIGVPIPGGEILLDKNTKELIYKGKNVMLGYATSRDDLDKGNECKGILRTGDIAYQDADGYFYISGRKSRFMKLVGLRINLDDVENIIKTKYSHDCACLSNDEKLFIFIEEEINSHLINIVSGELNIHQSLLSLISIKTLPRMYSGKIDYQKLTAYTLIKNKEYR